MIAMLTLALIDALLRPLLLAILITSVLVSIAVAQDTLAATYTDDLPDCHCGPPTTNRSAGRHATKGNDEMNYNDRLREASVWVSAHQGEMITLAIPREALADALWEASEDLRWPTALSDWARELARNTRGMCFHCIDAGAPADWWADRADWMALPAQPTHADCLGDGCTCPCRERGAAS